VQFLQHEAHIGERRLIGEHGVNSSRTSIREGFSS